MSIEYVYYDLHKGFIDNWLVAGPQLIPVKDAKQIPGHDDIRLQIARHFYEKGSGIRKQPVERGPVSEGVFKIGEYEGSWLYYPCREDHYVDSSVTSPAYVYLRSWAYVQIECEHPLEASLILTCNGPADIWLNDTPVHRQEQFQNQPARSAAFPVSFKAGGN